MGTRIKLNPAGTHGIGAYLAKPAGKPKGGVVVVQEIFGVTAHIQDVTDRFAAAGYVAVAPAFFDYVENDVALPYDRSGIDRGQACVATRARIFRQGTRGQGMTMHPEADFESTRNLRSTRFMPPTGRSAACCSWTMRNLRG